MASAAAFVSERSANLATDVHPGFYPQFERVQPRATQRLRELLVRPTVDLDFDALNVFLRIETFVGTDTAFRNIKADAPDYEWARSVPRTDLNRSQVIDAYISLFRQAIRRCHDTAEISMPLSGGQDSRHILLELCQQGRKPSTCWTVDFPWRRSEADVASQLCARLGIEHRLFRLKNNLATVEAKKNQLTDFSSVQHSWMAEAMLEGFAKDCVLYDGIGGDVLSAGLFLSERRVKLLEQGRIDELVEDIVGPEEFIFGVGDQSLFPRWRAVDKVNEEFRKHLQAVNPISSFYFWNRTRRDIGCSTFSLLRNGAKAVHTPYLDPDLKRFLAGLPHSMTVDHSLHKDVIAKAYPEFGDMPYASPGAKEFAHARPYFRKVAAMTLGYLTFRSCPIINRGKLSAQLIRSMILPRHAAESFFLAPRVVYLTELFRSMEV